MGKKIDTILSGMSADELIALVNHCCEHGVAEHHTSYGKCMLSTYTYDHYGVNLSLEIYHGMHPTFRLKGTNWAVTFLGSRGALRPPRGDSFDCRIGPMGVETFITKPVMQKFYATNFRRRGTKEAFRKDATLLRMFL